MSIWHVEGDLLAYALRPSLDHDIRDSVKKFSTYRDQRIPLRIEDARVVTWSQLLPRRPGETLVMLDGYASSRAAFGPLQRWKCWAAISASGQCLRGSGSSALTTVAPSQGSHLHLLAGPLRALTTLGQKARLSASKLMSSCFPLSSSRPSARHSLLLSSGAFRMPRSRRQTGF